MRKIKKFDFDYSMWKDVEVSSLHFGDVIRITESDGGIMFHNDTKRQEFVVASDMYSQNAGHSVVYGVNVYTNGGQEFVGLKNEPNE